jgi:hypothetical protein
MRFAVTVLVLVLAVGCGHSDGEGDGGPAGAPPDTEGTEPEGGGPGSMPNFDDMLPNEDEWERFEDQVGLSLMAYDWVLFLADATVQVDGVERQFIGFGPEWTAEALLGSPLADGTLSAGIGYTAGCTLYAADVTASLHARQDRNLHDSMSMWTAPPTAYMSLYSASEGEEWSARGEIVFDFSPKEVEWFGGETMWSRYTFSGTATENISNRKSPAGGEITCMFIRREVMVEFSEAWTRTFYRAGG